MSVVCDDTGGGGGGGEGVVGIGIGGGISIAAVVVSSSCRLFGGGEPDAVSSIAGGRGECS